MSQCTMCFVTADDVATVDSVLVLSAVDPAVPGGATEACGQLTAHGGGGGRLQRRQWG